MSSTTEKRPGTTNHGLNFETLLSCFSVCKLQQQGKTFFHYNNMKNAGAFDDNVCVSDDNITFTQAKHKDSGKLINASMFLNFRSLNSSPTDNAKINVEFSIFKYFESYIQIINWLSVKNDLIPEGDLNKKSLDFILYTPAVIDEESLHDFLVAVQFDHFLKTNSADGKSKIWKVNIEKIEDEILKEWQKELEAKFLKWMALLIRSQTTEKCQNIEECIQNFFKHTNISDAESFLAECSIKKVFSAGNANHFLTILETLMESDEDIRHKMGNIFFSENIFKRYLKDFFSKFKIFTYQANVHQLEELIKSLISEIHWNGDKTEETLIFNELKASFENWTSNAKTIDVLSEKCDFLRLAFDSVVFKGKHKSMNASIASLPKFSDEAIRSTQWSAKLLQKEDMMVNIYSEFPELSLTRVSQFLEANCPEFRIVDSNSFSFNDSRPRNLGTKFPCIVLYFEGPGSNSTIEFFKPLAHKLVIISHGRCNEVNESIEDIMEGLHELEETSRNLILQREINFQGKSMTLEALVGSAKVNVKFLSSLIKISDPLVITSKTTPANYDVNSGEYFVERSINNEKPKTFMESKEQVVLLTGDPGTGKSIFLTKNIENNIEKYPDHWIIRVNLLTKEKAISKFISTKINDDIVLNFLKSIGNDQLTANVHMTNILNELFECLLALGKVIVVLDGCDEIHQSCQRVVLDMVSHIKTSKIFSQTKLWIATRPTGIHTELENRLNVKSITLEPFDKQECRDVLNKYWLFSLKQYINGEINKHQINSFVDHTVNNFPVWIDKRTEDFLKTPLQLIMLASIMQDSCLEFHNSSRTKLSSEDKKKLNAVGNVYILYEKIVEAKLKHINNEKKGNNTAENIFLSNLINIQKFAALNVLGLENILTGEEKNAYTEDVEKLINNGIICQVSLTESQKQPIFIHHTFIDYFAALFFWDRYFRFGYHNYKEIIDKVFINFIVEENRAQISLFVHLMAKQKTNTQSIEEEPTQPKLNIEATQHLFNRLLEFEYINKSSSLLLGVVERCLMINPDSIKLKTEFKNIVKNEKKMTRWHIVAKHSYFRIAELLPLDDADIDKTDILGRTIVYCAVLGNCEEIVKKLVDKVDLSIQTNQKISPLHEAVIQKNEQILEILLKAGAKTDILGGKRNYRTPLYYAVANDDEAIANILIKYKANVNYIPLLPMFAGKKGKMTMIKWLVENNADLEATNENGLTALCVATLYNLENVAHLLVKHNANVNFEGPINQTPLVIATQQGNVEIVKMLLRHNADPNLTKSKTALYHAVSSNNQELVSLLLNNGANPNIKCNKIPPPLFVAITNRYTEVASLLLKPRENSQKNVTDVTDHQGFTPLQRALQVNDLKLVEMLIEHGARIDLCNLNIKSPLFIAISKGNIKLVKILIDKGGEMKIDVILTSLNFAKNYRHKEIFDLLQNEYKKAISKNSNCEGLSELHCAVIENNKIQVEQCIDNGHNVDCKSDTNSTPLGFAAQCGFIEIGNLLLQHKAEVNVIDSLDRSPLYWAIVNTNDDFAGILLDRGASVERKYFQNNNPICLAIQNSSTIDVFEKILEKGVDINEPDDNGNFPLIIAIRHKRTDVVKLFLKHKVNLECSSKKGLSPLELAKILGCCDIENILNHHSSVS